MTHETLSALLDGECSAEELERLLEQMDKDPSLAARYSRMVAARDSRDTRIRRSDPGFSARVMAAVSTDLRQSSPAVVPFRRKASLPNWRPAFGLAMAAGLGALAVLVFRPDTGELPATLVADAEPVAMATLPGSPSAAQATVVAQHNWDQLDPGDAERLNAYLIAYSQSRAEQGMGSTLGFARYAAHTAEYRPQRIQGPSARPADYREPVR